MGSTPVDDLNLRGDSRAPTAAPGDNDLTIANTAWVQNELSGFTPSLAMDDLSDVVATSPGSGSVLRFDGTNWDATSSTPGDGALLTGNAIVINDVNWFRDSTNMWRTNDSITVDAEIRTGTGNANGIRIGTNAKITEPTANNLRTAANRFTFAGTDSDNYLIDVQGGIRTTGNVSMSITGAVGPTYNVVKHDDEFINMSNAGASSLVNLPAMTDPDDVGRRYIIKDSDGTAAIFNITIDPNGTDQIDNASTYVMNTPNAKISIVWDGAMWRTY